MKLPKTIKRYCPYCKRHTEHKVMISPKGQRSHLTKGERYRREKLEHGYGGFPYSIYKEGGRYKVKIAKKLDIRFKCTVCGKMHVWDRGLRIKKYEFSK